MAEKVKKNKKEKKNQRIVQQDFPLANIRGHYAFLKDGSFRGYALLDGVNTSIFNEQQRQEEALRLSSVFATINVPWAILKYPIPSPSSKQLVLIDDAIERERKIMFAAKSEAERNAALQKISILTEHMRPDAKREASDGSRLSWLNWFVFMFDHKQNVDDADRVMSMFERVCDEQLGRSVHFATEEEIRKLYSLYFTPSAITNESLIYTQVPTPEL